MKRWMFVSFSILLVFLMLAVFFVQSKLSDRFYYEEKYKHIIEDCEELEVRYNNYNSGHNLRFNVDLANYMVDSGNMLIFVDENEELIFSTSAYVEGLQGKAQLDKKVIESFIDKFTENLVFNENGYSVEEIPAMKNEYLVAKHEFESGETMYVLSSLGRIREAISIVNRLLLRILGIVSILALLLVNILSGRISRSLKRLTRKAEAITELEFNEDLVVKGPKEIRQLGEAFNFLSGKLDETISNLNDANEQLKEDIDLKIRQDKIQRKFISDVSHDLKTPITIIKSYSEALVDKVGDRDFYSNGINEEAEKMKGMIEELLELSILESGTANFNWSEIDLNIIISTVANKMAPYVISREKEILYESIVSGNFIITGDWNKMERVIENLIMNSIMHSTEGNIDIRLWNEGEEVLIEVCNKSLDVSEEDIERMWDRFYKGDQSRNREKSGSGLGLAIVKSIVEKHGGRCGACYLDGVIKFFIRLKLKI